MALKNPFGAKGKYRPLTWEDTSAISENPELEASASPAGLGSTIEPTVLGGEITNETDINWLVSGGANSKLEEFILIPVGENSDDVPEVDTVLDGDVDALWVIGGVKVKNGVTGKVVSNGVFKIGDLDNAVIKGNGSIGYTISGFTAYFAPGSEPTGWKLPKYWGGTD